jgi:hypothetical protein
MTITWEMIAAICGILSIITTVLWHAATAIGKLINRVDDHETRLERAERDINAFKGQGV